MKMKTVLTVLLISSAVTACSNNVKPTNNTSQKTVGDIMKRQHGSAQAENFRQGPQRWQTSPATCAEVC